MEMWKETLDLIKASVNPQSFGTWFVPMEFIALERDVLTLRVKNDFTADWMTQNYIDLIRDKASTVTGKSIDVSFEVAPAEKNGKPSESYKADSSYRPDYLNERYVFDNFVVGASNQFAYSAAKAVAEAPGKTKFNPLLIYGGSGLGKTHLIQAVGHHVRTVLENARVYYITSEQFKFDFIEAIKNNRITEFSHLYREADLLLVDDVQFFTGQERTQEEFFQIFNTLYQNQKQIVLTSDRPPKDLPGLEERLISRFQWGLIVDIQPPDKETRIAIIRKRTEKEGLSIPDEVVDFIAENTSSSIRELEGRIIKLMAFSSLNKKDISLELAMQILKVDMQQVKKKVSIDAIIETVAKFYGVPVNTIREKNRRKEVIFPRMVSMYLAKQMTQYSLKTIGLQFGGRDHSTVIHALHTVEEKLTSEASFKDELDSIVKQVNG